MGKLSDVPDDRTQGAAGLSREALEVKHFLAHLEDLLHEESLRWASATIEGIRLTVQGSQRVTEGQRRAIANIRKHQGDDTQRKPSRRYEGW